MGMDWRLSAAVRLRGQSVADRHIGTPGLLPAPPPCRLCRLPTRLSAGCLIGDGGPRGLCLLLCCPCYRLTFSKEPGGLLGVGGWLFGAPDRGGGGRFLGCAFRLHLVEYSFFPPQSW
jgi:hypothetical protein